MNYAIFSFMKGVFIMSRYHIIVYGYVQGVGFRYFTNHTARNFDLTGWVRNNYDGTVEMEVQGREENILAFIERIKDGSRYSEVQDISVKMIDIIDNERSFNVMV